ncbi:MAG: GNAT family N-acetyltransferase [Xanthomonadales bacterium]|jgi:GNAT superfamily N-acetyltransferase|nr:GNAT family N-acetyltransferase [Xanthomonadales bacterium]
MPLDPDLDLDIRPLRRSDEPAWRTLWTGYLAYYETELPEAIYASTFERLLSEDPHEFHGLLAVLDGTPVGLVHFVFHRSCWSIENTCYLQDLFVDPAMRGKSIGRALIEAVYAAADEAGHPDVYWQTQHFNTTGRRLYDRVGKLSDFVIYERA